MSAADTASWTALRAVHSYGFNKDLRDGVVNISTESRKAVFYVAGHTGVIFYYQENVQVLLQGHVSLSFSLMPPMAGPQWVRTEEPHQMCLFVGGPPVPRDC